MSLLDTLAPLRTHGHARTTGLDDVTPVSYTHLDVYKRQGLCHALPLALSGIGVRAGVLRKKTHGTA